MALAKLTVQDFIEQLASANPTPGGGSASALAGAMSAAMVEMANARDSRVADDSDLPVPPPHLAKVWATAPVPVPESPALALELDTSRVHVSLRQKARGGITITASL